MLISASNMATKRSPTVGASKIETPHFVSVRRNQEQVDPAKREIIFFEHDNPRSVINLLTDKLQTYARQLTPELLGMAEKEMIKRLKPTEVDQQIRIAFWDEYFITIDNDSPRMRMDAVFARVCSKEYFYNHIITDEVRLAWMLKPPQDYLLQMRSLLNIGMKRFQEILEMKLDPGGKADTRLIAEIVKIVTLIDNRVKGAVVQKIQLDATQKNLNMNVNYEAPKSHQQIEQELRDIEREISSLRSPGSDLKLFEGDHEQSEPLLIEASSYEVTPEGAGITSDET